MILEYVHYLCLGDGDNLTVSHRASYHLGDILHGCIEVLCMDEIGHVLSLLIIRFLVNGNECELRLVIAVGTRFLVEEYLAERSEGNILHLEPSADLCGHFLNDAFLCLCEAHCIYDITLCNFLLHTILLNFLVADFADEPLCCS